MILGISNIPEKDKIVVPIKKTIRMSLAGKINDFKVEPELLIILRARFI